MKCKHCNTEILDKVIGLRDFHPECRDEYRRIYQAKVKRKSRQNKNMMYTSYPTDVNKSNPYESRVHEESNDKPETLYEDYGGKSWYSFAKKECDNFPVREKEGYCVDLFEARNTFRSKCRDCPLGKDLMKKAKEAKKEVRK
jgi:hypothetical protein